MKNIRPSVLVVSLAVGLAVPARASTTLTFASATGTSGSVIPATLGSYATGSGADWTVNGDNTANIGLLSAASGPTWKYYRDSSWTGVAYLNPTALGGSFSMTFTPDAGYGVSIESLWVSSFYNDVHYGFTWEVIRVSDDTVMKTGDTGDITWNTSRDIAFDFVAPDDRAYKLLFTCTSNTKANGSSHSLTANFAVDNLTFSQHVVAVPEPGSYASAGCVAVALAVLAGRRNKTR